MRRAVSDMLYRNDNVVNSFKSIRLVETRTKRRMTIDDCMIVHRKENT